MKNYRNIQIIVIAVLFTAICLWLLTIANFWQVLFIGVNIGAFYCYGLDKYQAKRSGWRVSEATLLVFALLGGSVGSILGQQVFRHKTRKSRFLRVFWTIAAVQVVALLAWSHWRNG